MGSSTHYKNGTAIYDVRANPINIDSRIEKLPSPAFAPQDWRLFLAGKVTWHSIYTKIGGGTDQESGKKSFSVKVSADLPKLVVEIIDLCQRFITKTENELFDGKVRVSAEFGTLEDYGLYIELSMDVEANFNFTPWVNRLFEKTGRNPLPADTTGNVGVATSCSVTIPLKDGLPSLDTLWNTALPVLARSCLLGMRTLSIENAPSQKALTDGLSDELYPGWITSVTHSAMTGMKSGLFTASYSNDATLVVFKDFEGISTVSYWPSHELELGYRMFSGSGILYPELGYRYMYEDPALTAKAIEERFLSVLTYCADNPNSNHDNILRDWMQNQIVTLNNYYGTEPIPSEIYDKLTLLEQARDIYLTGDNYYDAVLYIQKNGDAENTNLISQLLINHGFANDWMFGDQIQYPPQTFDGSAVSIIPPDTLEDTTEYHFLIARDGSVEVYGLEGLAGYLECAEKYGPAVAGAIYSAAIQQYFGSPDTEVPPEIKTEIKEIKQELITGDEPGLKIYYRQTGPDGVKEFQYFYPNISDRNAVDNALLRIRIDPLNHIGNGSEVRKTEQRNNNNWILVSTKELRNYGDLSVIKTIPADKPDNYSVDVTRNEDSLFGKPVSIGAIGSALGSSIGSIVSGDNLFKQLTLSPLLETIGQNLFQAIGVGLAQNRGDLSDDVLDVFNDFSNELGANVRDAAGGVVSSLLTAELMRAIDAEGLGGELASTITNAMLGQISRNIITIGINELTEGATSGVLGNPDSIFSGINIDLIGNAVGSFIGSKLAYEALAGYDSEEEAIGAQIGGAVAGAATLFAIGSIAGPVGWAVAALASFVGNFLGGTIGDLINSARPDKASAQLIFNPDTGEFEIGYVWKKRDGSIEGVKALANAAGDAMNYVVDIVGGDILDGKDFSGLFLWKESRNLHGPGYFEKGTYFENAGGLGYWYRDRSDFSDVVERGVIDMLGRLEIAGGNIYFKRALYNSLPSLLEENGRPIEDPLQVLSGNLKIASDYAAYLESRDLINSLMALQPDSIFAAGWLATLARAAELNLNRRHRSDFYGGWSYLLDSAGAVAAMSGLNYGNRSRLIGLANDMEGYVLGDIVDVESKTIVAGSGLIDLRETVRHLIAELHQEGNLLIQRDGEMLPEELKELRLEGNVLWLGDTKLALLGSGGISRWYNIAPLLGMSNGLSYVIDLAKGLATGNKRLADGEVEKIVAQIESDGTLVLTTPNETLDGAAIQNGELVRDGYVVAVQNEDGSFSDSYGDEIPVSAVILGSDEDDIIYSGDLGNDIFAGDGNDTVYGGANADWIYGGEGDDTLYAGDTDGNALFGGAGNDELHGGKASDWLEGGDGDDALYGGEGGDILSGGTGSDYLEGGLGDDQYVFQRGHGDTLIADHGADSASEDTDPTDIGDMLSFGPDISVEDLTYGRSGDDLLIHVGGASDDTVETITATDWFTEEGRIERFEFPDGSRISIAEIDQFINGTAENDNFGLADIEGDVLINSLAGDDTIDLRDTSAFSEGDGTSNTIWDFLPTLLGIGSEGSGHVVVSGDGEDIVYGGSGDDVLIGGNDDDALYGVAGDDTLDGGSGDDQLTGGEGDDTLTGGLGDDSLTGDAGSDLLWGDRGNDLMDGGGGSDIYCFALGDGQDALIDEHVTAPEDARLVTLLEDIDALLPEQGIADTSIDLPLVSQVIVDIGQPEARVDALLAMIGRLRPIATAVGGITAERVGKALDQMQRELKKSKSHIGSEDLEQYVHQFKTQVLDTAGLFDAVNFGGDIDVGDVNIAWEGDDLLLRLQDDMIADSSEESGSTDQGADQGSTTDNRRGPTPALWSSTPPQDDTADDDSPENNTAADVLRLREWGISAPYIERFDFTNGQVDAAGINQWIGGSDGDDQLTGTSDHDWITGGAGNDTIAAGSGDDILNGNSGDDTLRGEDGDDLINGGSGDDQLFGGSGDDLINGGDGDDLMNGGAGADQFDGGDGMDKVSYADAAAGVRVYLDNGASLEIDRGLSGEIHERTLGEGTGAERDALIKQILEALPDPDELIQDIADTVPWAENLKLPFTTAIAAGQREAAVQLLQNVFDGSREILLGEERTALLEAIDFVNLEPLPAEAEMEAFWDQVVPGVPDRGELIERIADQVPSQEEQGEKIAAFIIQGNRTGLINAINSWLSPLFGEEAQAKAEEILALIPEQLPAMRGSIGNLATAVDVIANTDAYASFTSTGLDYGPEEKDTLGSFLRSDGASLAEEQRVGPFDNLAVKLSGYIYLEKGRHDFTVTSDDGFELKIGGTTFTKKSGKEVSADFETGFYRFELTYFDHQGDEELSVTSESLADGNALDSSFFYTDPLQADPRLTEQSDVNGRGYLSYPDTPEQGDHYQNVEGVIGSAHDDLLWGDAADNLLIGGDGNDNLRGGAGNDRLEGGAGNDSYEFGRGDGRDVIADNAGEDFIMLGEEITPEQLWLARVGDALELSIIGSNDKLTVADWYSDPGSHIEAITTKEGLTLLDTQVESLVQAMSAFSPPAMGDATFGLSQEDQNSISGLIAASWQ